MIENNTKEVVENVYYVDYNDLTIYDKDGNIVGKIGSEGYSVNLNTNQLKKDNLVIGVIEDSRSLKRGSEVNYSKPYVRTLKKEKNSRFNAAFVTVQATLLVLILAVFLVAMVTYFMK